MDGYIPIMIVVGLVIVCATIITVTGMIILRNRVIEEEPTNGGYPGLWKSKSNRE